MKFCTNFSLQREPLYLEVVEKLGKEHFEIRDEAYTIDDCINPIKGLKALFFDETHTLDEIIRIIRDLDKRDALANDSIFEYDSRSHKFTTSELHDVLKRISENPEHEYCKAAKNLYETYFINPQYPLSFKKFYYIQTSKKFGFVIKKHNVEYSEES